MAENQNEHQHENRDLQKVDKNTDSYTGRFWRKVFSAAIIVGFLLALLCGPRDEFELIILTIPAVILLIMAGITSIGLAGIARFCLGIFWGRKPTWGTMRLATYIFSCFIFALVAFIVFLVYDAWQNPSGSGVEASNIVSNLRSLQSASLMLREDKGELVYELPRGVNIAEYLTRYTAVPEAPVWRDYKFIIADNDYWWVGGLYVGRSRRGSTIRSRLEGRAESVGLFGTSQPEPPSSNDRAYQYQASDPFVWMLIRIPATGDANREN